MLPPLKNGEVLRGRYKISERIGQGGMGSIYLADDIRLKGRQCALKEVEYDRALPENIRDEAREQFLREATVLARLDHPNLPKVSDFFSNGPRDYLVMDYVPGDDLRALLMEARRKKFFLKETDVLSWADQVANGLSFLHSQEPPIVHRDIIFILTFAPIFIHLGPHSITCLQTNRLPTLENVSSTLTAWFRYDKLILTFPHARNELYCGQCPCTQMNVLRPSMNSAKLCWDIPKRQLFPSRCDMRVLNPFGTILQILPKQPWHGVLRFSFWSVYWRL